MPRSPRSAERHLSTMSTIRIGRDDFDATRHDTDPFLLRHPGLGDLSRRAHSRPIPPIPDLRFEYTYLKNIRSHVRVERIEESATTDEKGVAGDEQVASLSKEVVHVEWGSVMWVTFKEQFVSPLVQGVLWRVRTTVRHL